MANRTAILCRILRKAGLLAGAAMLPLSTAAADFQCLDGSTASVLRWDGSWQSDRLDHDVNYRITDLVRISSGASRSITIEMEALSPAEKSERFLAIASDLLASEVCKRLSKSSSLEAAPRDKSAEKNDSADRLRFIKYTARGWVRDDPPPRKTLAKCIISGIEFLCLEEEKQRYGDQLDLVGAELRAQPKLYR